MNIRQTTDRETATARYRRFVHGNPHDVYPARRGDRRRRPGEKLGHGADPRLPDRHLSGYVASVMTMSDFDGDCAGKRLSLPRHVDHAVACTGNRQAR